MQIKVKQVKNNLIIELSGELDHHHAAEFREKFDAEWNSKAVRNLILNFAGITFMDSSGVGVIIGRYKQVDREGGKVAISNPTPGVKKLIEISGLTRIVSVFSTEEEALQSLE